MWIPNSEADVMLPPPPRGLDLRGADEKLRWINILNARLRRKLTVKRVKKCNDRPK